jgi:predicted nucleic acid-binding protein
LKDSPNLFWDSCVFIRYLTGGVLADEIGSLIADARKKSRTIYFSTIAFAEIRQRHFKGTTFGDIQDFFHDLGAAFEPIDPNPNILIAAGELRDAAPTSPSGDTRAQAERVIGTADAIHLATCIYARDVMGISDIIFHTLDEGKGKTWEGRCVPLLGFERWFPEATRAPRVAEVCGLERRKPLHPQMGLGLGGLDGATDIARGA